MQIIVPDNYSANCCSGQLNFSSCSPSIELLQVVVLETLFANYTIQCLGQFICKFCKLSLRPGYSLFASCTTCCSGHFVYKFLRIIVPCRRLRSNSKKHFGVQHIHHLVNAQLSQLDLVFQLISHTSTSQQVDLRVSM